ncbi:MAG: PEP-CTERM sorting domain-containing protein [Desulfobacteraceae bacterium]|nr:PEP-CTERM sorting domain-containing protein [Desulfobacteraceae bacterium]
MMKKRLLVGMLTGLLIFCMGGFAQATSFDQNVTPGIIFGDGNLNGGFTVDQANGVELGLRGKVRHNSAGSPENTFNSNGDGTYSFDAGVAVGQSHPTATWSFEWSINTDYSAPSTPITTLGSLRYELGLDFDPTVGSNFFVFDPINDINPDNSLVFWDHSLGTNMTTDADDFVAASDSEYATFLGTQNVAQNSWKPHWFIPGFDPTIDASYDIYLAAFDSNGDQMARTEIQIIVGDGAATVPEPTTMLLFGFGLLGLAGVSRKKS